MRVLQLIHGFPPASLGGAEIYARDLAMALSDLGHEVVILTPEHDPQKGEYTVSWGRSGVLPHIRVNHAYRHPEHWDTLYARCAPLDALFASILRDVHPDVVHVHHLSGLSLGFPKAARDRGIPVVYTVHDFWYLCPRGQMLRGDGGRCDEIDVSRCVPCLDAALHAEEEAHPEQAVSLLSLLPLARSSAGVGGATPSLTRYEIAGVAKDALFAHPPLAVTFTLDIPRGAPELSFALGMSPEVFSPSRGEGVRFRVRAAGQVVFEELWDPKRRPEHRAWGERRVDLVLFAGCRVDVQLETAPEHQDANQFNWAAWGMPRIATTRGQRVAARGTAFAEELGRARAVICPSRFLMGVHERAGVDTRVLRHADYGFDGSRFAGFRRRPSPSFRVGFLGTLIPSKGADVLIRAFRRAALENAELSIWGRAVPYFGSTAYGAELSRIAGEPSPLRGEIAPEQVRAAFESIDVLVVPSLWAENSPLTIHEAFLTGTPVVASDLGGMAELVKPGENGLLFGPGDEAALAKCLASLAGDRSLLERLSLHTAVRSLADDARSLIEIYG